MALTGASRPSLPTGETDGSASDLALRFLSPAGRDARAKRGSEGKLTIIKTLPKPPRDESIRLTDPEQHLRWNDKSRNSAILSVHMVAWILKKILGSKNQRELKRLRPIVQRMNEFDEQFKGLSDDELRAKTAA